MKRFPALLALVAMLFAVAAPPAVADPPPGINSPVTPVAVKLGTDGSVVGPTNGLPVNCVSGCSGGSADSTAANQATQITAANLTNTNLGGVTETAPATDTASSGINGRLQRLAQRLTTLITNLGTPLQSGGAVTISSGTISLPSGASTAAKQPALGTAASPSTDIITVQGPNLAGTAASGAPLPMGCIFQNTLPTYSDLNRGAVQCDTKGQLGITIRNAGNGSIAVVGTPTDNVAAQISLWTINQPEIWNGSSNYRQLTVIDGTNTTGNGVAAAGVLAQCDDTSPTAISENSFGNLRMTCGTRALIVRPFESRANTWNYPAPAGGLSNTTTAVTVIAADASRRICITSLDISYSALGTGGEYVLRDGAGGTVVWRGYLGTAGGSLTPPPFESPVCGTANTLLEFAALTASGTGAVYLNARGFYAAN